MVEALRGRDGASCRRARVGGQTPGAVSLEASSFGSFLYGEGKEEP
jgi:hypothetical protein